MASSPCESISDAYLDHLVKTPPRPASLDLELKRLLGDLDTRDKILIYAFGAFDRYYVCWQDRNGAYRQERQGLPHLLDKWLFPSDGSSRDLATLQVSLGHNDEFFAFDQYERISHINAELRGSATGARSQYPLQPVANTSARMAIRRKSHTFSHSDEVPDTDQQRPSAQLRQRLKRQSRPWSIAISGVPPPKPSHKILHERASSPEKPPGSPRTKYTENITQQRPMYSDAGVQTESEDVDSDALYSGLGSNSPGHILTSQFSPTSEGPGRTVPNSVRSVEEYSWGQTENPVSIGLMGDYFRKRQYRLGDALIRVPANIGVY